LIFGSVCSGIEAASCAWHPLGWQAAFVSDIEKFPCAVLAHHYPDVPNLGDMTKFKEWPDAAIDVLVGGTPCQSFSVAGLRKGLADPRGNLMLTYLAIADRYRPRWLVWENVPGVLSSNGGRDFGSFLGGLAQLGYGFAYRVLDAQYAGVPQRRRRVFVVGYLGDWRRAAAVLFERHSLQGHPAPSRQAGERVADSLTVGANQCSGFPGDFTNDIAPTISARTKGGGGLGTDFDCDGGLIAHSLRAEGFDASEDGTGRGTPLVPVAFEWQRGDTQNMDLHVNFSPSLIKSQAPAFYSITPSNSNKDYNARLADKAQAVTAGGNRPSARGGDLVTSTLVSNGDAHSGGRDEHGLVPVEAVAFEPGSIARRAGPRGEQSIVSTLRKDMGDNLPAVRQGSAVRRLTPRECERLQGFPDDYTLIPYRGKPAADGPRYKALGNSMAVPCMFWIGERIAEVDKIIPPPLLNNPLTSRLDTN